MNIDSKIYVIDNDGKFAHLKYAIDDLNPNIKHLWARLHDKINGILIFMTDIHEDYFLDADIWLIDDPFKSAPKQCVQVLNIMGTNLLKNNYLTIRHIFLKGKREVDYTNGLTHF